ncbi:FMRFamide peptide receptor frpr-18-like [Lineus longissimus]|uniref:FMRFamide peptide receptor frpr-18-like n=1 Tax=Lineus longissimus TaxID=88925 RepID=UPI00315CDCDD
MDGRVLGTTTIPSTRTDVLDRNMLNVTECLYRRTTDFDAIALTLYITKVYMMPVLALLGFIGNSLSFVVLTKEMRSTPTAFLLKALAVADNAVLTVYLCFFSISCVYEYTGHFLPYKKYFEMTKSYSWALLWFTKVISVYLVVAVTVERFIAVCRPHKARTWCKIKNARTAVGCICMFSLIYNLPKCFSWETALRYDPCLEETVPIGIDTALGKNQYFNTFYKVILYIMTVFIIPLTTILALNYQLIKAITVGGHRGNLRKRRHTNYDAITKRVVAVCGVFLILELPAVLMNILEIIAYIDGQVKGYQPLYLVSETTNGLIHLAYTFSALNSCVNFYIYFLTGNQFRRTLKWMLLGHSNGMDKSAPNNHTLETGVSVHR